MTAANSADAHIVEQALRAEGVGCQVVGDYLEASMGNLPGVQPEIWVHRRDLARAEGILRELRSQAEADADEPEA
jgi:hypothetical protein